MAKKKSVKQLILAQFGGDETSFYTQYPTREAWEMACGGGVLPHANTGGTMFPQIQSEKQFFSPNYANIPAPYQGGSFEYGGGLPMAQEGDFGYRAPQKRCYCDGVFVGNVPPNAPCPCAEKTITPDNIPKDFEKYGRNKNVKAMQLYGSKAPVGEPLALAPPAIAEPLTPFVGQPRKMGGGLSKAQNGKQYDPYTDAPMVIDREHPEGQSRWVNPDYPKPLQISSPEVRTWFEGQPQSIKDRIGKEVDPLTGKLIYNPDKLIHGERFWRNQDEIDKERKERFWTNPDYPDPNLKMGGGFGEGHPFSTQPTFAQFRSYGTPTRGPQFIAAYGGGQDQLPQEKLKSFIPNVNDQDSVPNRVPNMAAFIQRTGGDFLKKKAESEYPAAGFAQDGGPQQAQQGQPDPNLMNAIMELYEGGVTDVEEITQALIQQKYEITSEEVNGILQNMMGQQEQEQAFAQDGMQMQPGAMGRIQQFDDAAAGAAQNANVFGGFTDFLNTGANAYGNRTLDITTADENAKFGGAKKNLMKYQGTKGSQVSGIRADNPTDEVNPKTGKKYTWEEWDKRPDNVANRKYMEDYINQRFDRGNKGWDQNSMAQYQWQNPNWRGGYNYGQYPTSRGSYNNYPMGPNNGYNNWFPANRESVINNNQKIWINNKRQGQGAPQSPWQEGSSAAPFIPGNYNTSDGWGRSNAKFSKGFLGLGRNRLKSIDYEFGTGARPDFAAEDAQNTTWAGDKIRRAGEAQKKYGTIFPSKKMKDEYARTNAPTFNQASASQMGVPSNYVAPGQPASEESPIDGMSMQEFKNSFPGYGRKPALQEYGGIPEYQVGANFPGRMKDPNMTSYFDVTGNMTGETTGDMQGDIAAGNQFQVSKDSQFNPDDNMYGVTQDYTKSIEQQSAEQNSMRSKGKLKFKNRMQGEDAANWAIAGTNLAANIFSQDELRGAEAQANQARQLPNWMASNIGENRGFHHPNTGKPQPDKYNPIGNFTGGSSRSQGSMLTRYGGQLEIGTSYNDLSEQDLQDLRDGGYEFEITG